MLERLIVSLNELIWSRFFLPGLIICGLVLSLRCGALQLRFFPQCISGSLGAALCRKSENTQGLSSFQAASAALASTVGTGNIVGTAQALCLGGAGAIFWMWAASFLGMIVKYAEILLAMRYRRRGVAGSPMLYIRAAFSRFGRPLAAFYALSAALAGLSMGNITQVNCAADSLVRAAEMLGCGGKELSLRLGFGIVLALLTLVLLSGGAAGIGRAASLLVPFMSVGFILLSLGVLCCRVQQLPGVLVYIIKDAFSPRAALGASGALAGRSALMWGLRRSAFSNEAGLGTSAIAHGLSQGKSPVEEGFWGVFEVFTDTTLLCTLTALTILCSGAAIPYGSTAGSELLCRALSQVYGGAAAELFVCACMLLLAFSSVLGWALYGVQCWEYLFGEGSGGVYRLIFTLTVIPGALMNPGLVWSLADFFNALMSLPNLTALLLLSGQVGHETMEYINRKFLDGEKAEAYT